MQPIDLTTQTLYVELLDSCRVQPVRPPVPTPYPKHIGGVSYLYVRVLGKEQCLGRADRIGDRIAAWRDANRQAADIRKRRERLVAMLAAGGANVLPATLGSVFEALDMSGVLSVGVLVGSHAMEVYGNLLGYRWARQATKTNDIDLLGDNTARIEIGVSDNGDLGATLKRIDPDAFLIPALDRRQPGTSWMIRNKAIKVDLLTPMKGRPSNRPVFLPRIKAFASPLRFMDYLLEDLRTGVLLSRYGFPVNIPSPARFALHKLVVSRRRDRRRGLAEARKDLLQARYLLQALLDDAPGELARAIDGSIEMPEKFRLQMREGALELPDVIAKPLREMMDTEAARAAGGR